jgi:RHS repeat-associated protein
VKTWNGANAAFDVANDLQTDPSNSAAYTWDSRLQLSNFSEISASFQPIYDALGRRASLASSASGTTTYLHDDSTVVSSTNGGTSNGLLTIPGSGEVLAYSTTSGSMTNSWVPIHDGLGSTVALVDSTGAMSTQYTYDPYGNTTQTGQMSSFPFLYAGMEQDSSGLYHAMARYYSPNLQRFLSEDPFGFGGGDINLLNYSGNDPINGSDPTGNCPYCIAYLVAVLVTSSGETALLVYFDPLGLFTGGGQLTIPRKEVHLQNKGEGKRDAGVADGYVLAQAESGGGDGDDEDDQNKNAPNPFEEGAFGNQSQLDDTEDLIRRNADRLEMSTHAQEEANAQNISRDKITKSVRNATRAEPSYRGRWQFYNSETDVTVIVATADGVVVTVHTGPPKAFLLP